MDLIQKYHSEEKLLDVGSAKGEFIKVAIENGFDAEGVEASEDASTYTREILNVKSTKLRFTPCTIARRLISAASIKEVVKN